MRIEWLRRALNDIDEEAEYISRDDSAAAARVVERITAGIEQLATYPALGRIGRVPGTRELAIAGTPYIVPYRVRRSTVEILRVFHGARKWAKSS